MLCPHSIFYSASFPRIFLAAANDSSLFVHYAGAQGNVGTQQPSGTHTSVYDAWFQFADSDRDGRVTGKDAVGFFEKSGLSREVLAKV